MPDETITLGDMQRKGMTMLDVACRRCEARPNPRQPAEARSQSFSRYVT